MQTVLEMSKFSSRKSNLLCRTDYSTVALALVSPQFSLLGHCPTDPWWVSTLTQKLQGHICRNYQFINGMPCLAWVCPFPKACLRSCAYWPCSFNHICDASWEWTDREETIHSSVLHTLLSPCREAARSFHARFAHLPRAVLCPPASDVAAGLWPLKVTAHELRFTLFRRPGGATGKITSLSRYTNTLSA